MFGGLHVFIDQPQNQMYRYCLHRQVERPNRTLLQMLRTLTEKQKSDWRESLPKLIYADNSIRSKETSYLPPVWKITKVTCWLVVWLDPETETAAHQEYMKKVETTDARQRWDHNSKCKKCAKKGTRNYDIKVRISVLCKGIWHVERGQESSGITAKIASIKSFVEWEKTCPYMKCGERT